MITTNKQLQKTENIPEIESKLESKINEILDLRSSNKTGLIYNFEKSTPRTVIENLFEKYSRKGWFVEYFYTSAIEPSYSLIFNYKSGGNN